MKVAIALLLLAAALLLCVDAPAQGYPTKSVRVIIPISPGSGLDIVGRMVCQKLAETWGQTVLVDNRPGAGTTIGSAMVAKSAADGYTLLVSGSPHAANPAIYASLSYDAAKDFVDVAPLGRLYQVLVLAPAAGIKSVSALIAAAKAKPGQLTFASAGTGGAVHFTGEKFKFMTGIDVVHVPFKGGPEAMTDVMMGRVTYWIPSIGTALPFIQGGKLLALGVSSAKRSASLPEVPTIAEAGVPGFEDSFWIGMFAPARTPAEVVDRLSKDIARALASADLREQFGKLVTEPMSMTPAEFTRFVRSETEAYARVAKAAGIKAQ